MRRIAHPAGLAATAVGIALSALTLPGCTSSGGNSGDGSSASAPPSSTSTAPSSSASSAEPSTTKTVTKSASVSPTGSAGDGSGGGATQLSDCAESQLRASIDPRPVSGSSTRGAYARIVDFRNTSSRACLIRGYPGAALTYTDGQQVRQATRTIRGRLLGLPPSQHTLPTVTLQPGATASAGLEGVNQKEQGAAQVDCDSFYPGIVVTPPNTRTPVPFDVRWPKCYSFSVHPTDIEKNPPS